MPSCLKLISPFSLLTPTPLVPWYRNIDILAIHLLPCDRCQTKFLESSSGRACRGPAPLTAPPTSLRLTATVFPRDTREVWQATPRLDTHITTVRTPRVLFIIYLKGQSNEIFEVNISKKYLIEDLQQLYISQVPRCVCLLPVH